MSIRASLTGNLVFSTLHTNDSDGTVTRLIDMGVESFLIAMTMIASIIQRLLRKVCSQCGTVYKPTPDSLQALRLSAEEIEQVSFRKGTWCEQYRQTGYKGRFSIAEILLFTQKIKEFTVESARSTVIKQCAQFLGMRTLRDAGWLRVASGDITLDEVLRVLADTDMNFKYLHTLFFVIYQRF